MIDRETIVEIIRDYQEMDLPDLIKRNIDIPLDLRIKRAISIIGPRRAGKTYTMFQLMKILLERGVGRDRMLYINFEDYRLEGINYIDLKKIVEIYYEMYPENSRLKVWFFLDEIQNVGGWEKVVRNIMDRWNIQIFLSGSSSKLLSREIATQLRGRTLTYIVYPFSFKEFLRARNFRIEKYMSSYEKNRLLNLLNEYLVYGGYPEAVIERERRMKILREIWDVTIARDIIDRWRIRNIRALKLLIRALRKSREFSIHKFYRYLKSLGLRISKNTLYNYIEYLNDSLILYLLKKYSPSYRDIEMSIPKIFFVDNGLYMAEESISKLMENPVFMELRRRNYVENEKLFYWKNSFGREIDFIVLDGELIQVCYELTYENRDREIKSLIKASKQLNYKKLRILTWNQEDTININNRKIEITPLWKWLINKNQHI